MSNQPWRLIMWRKGECLDLWSVSHILAGAILGYAVFFLDFSFWFCFVFSTLLMVGWEIYEIIRKVEEKICNKIMDVLTGILGFVGANILFIIKLNRNVLIILFVIFSIMCLSLNLWGFFVYKNKNKREQNIDNYN